MSTETTPYCYRHPERETHVRCQRCGRPICPDCMNQAAVGFQCPTCVQEGLQSTRSGRATYGGSRTGNPARTSQVLIAINVVMWLLISATGRSGSPWLEKLALVPAGRSIMFPDGSVQHVPGVAEGAWWQFVTAMFIHVDLLHVGFNMLALWFLGPQLEAAIGRARFLAVYFLSGLTGSAFVYWLSPEHTTTFGASGAIYGLMGALLVIAIKVGADYSQILLWLGINVMITIFGLGLISWQAHLGGLVGGVVVAVVFVYSPRRRRQTWQVLGLVVFALALLVAIAVRTLALV